LAIRTYRFEFIQEICFGGIMRQIPHNRALKKFGFSPRNRRLENMGAIN